MVDVVHTVQGELRPEDLGVISLNEFVLLGLPGWDLAPEASFDEAAAFDAIKARLAAFKQAGGGTIVDNSGIASGRRADFLQRLSQVTGVNIVASTGFSDELFTPGHFFPDRNRDADYLARLFINEIRLGIVTRAMVRTQIKAGLVRTGYLAWPMTAMEEMCHRGAARAAKATGVAIYTSGEQTSAGALELLLGEGAPVDRIVVGHCDDGQALDPARDRAIAEGGAYVAYDHVGWEDGALHPGAVSDEQRADLVAQLVETGHLERVLVSAGAIGARPDGEPFSRHGYAHLLTSFVPRLKARGLSDAQVRTILHDNPARVLAVAG